MKTRITAIIIDDEQLDRELLHQLIADYCKHIIVLGNAGSVSDGLALYQSCNPDVVFLDIQMHGETGFEFIKAINTQLCKIVFTTGFTEYGIKAVKAGAFEYLLKPIDVDELEEVERKLLKQMDKPPLRNSIMMLHKGEQLIVDIDKLLYVAAKGSYCEVFLTDGLSITVSKNLKTFIGELSSPDFIQVHRSVAVNCKYCISYKNSGNEGLLTIAGDITLPVSRSFKSSLLEHIK